jgi:hypothetical protein
MVDVGEITITSRRRQIAKNTVDEGESRWQSESIYVKI